MSKFLGKPVEIDAMQWDGTRAGYYDICAWLLRLGSDIGVRFEDGYRCQGPDTLSVPGIDARQIVRANEWIVRGGDGRLAVCKPDVFAEMYEPAPTPKPKVYR